MDRLAALLPTKKARVIDLVKKAGVNVKDWANFKGGARLAAANPKYCYEWSFLEPGKVVVLNLWHGLMEQRGRSIVTELDMRRQAKTLARRGAKAVWVKRAERMDEAIQAAYADELPVRAIIVDGTRRRWNDPEGLSSRVRRRGLDPQPWAVTSYDPRTGDGMLTRDAKPARSNRSVLMSDIRSTILKLGKEITTHLRKDLRCCDLMSLPDRRQGPYDDHTGGYWMKLGTIPGGVSAQIWLDRLPGLPDPRVWIGFGSRSPRRLSRILSLAPLESMKKSLIRRTGRDLTGGAWTRFKNALRPDEFDVLLREDYEREHFLGVYYPYGWPLAKRERQTLVREAANFIGTVCEALAEPTPESSARLRVPGPWARPDRRSEKAAIRHVSRHLRRNGFSVRSREREICGYDLHATRRGREVHVEVKGCRGSVPRFFLSRTELRAAETDPDWRLAVVTNATRRPAEPRLLNHATMLRSFVLGAVQWEGRAKRTRA